MNAKTQSAQANNAKQPSTDAEKEMKDLTEAKTKAEEQVVKLQKDLETEQAAKVEAEEEVKSLQNQLAATKSNAKAGKSKSSDKQERRTFTLLTNARVNGALAQANQPCDLTEQEHAELFALGGVNKDWEAE